MKRRAELDAFIAANPQYASRDSARAQMNKWKRAGKFVPVRINEQRDAAGLLLRQSVTSVPPREQHKPLDGAVLSRRSALVDAEGNIIQQWLIEKPEDRAKREQWEEIARVLAEPIPAAPIIAYRHSAPSTELMACYPIGDHHLGMLSWHHETGASYDLEIGEALLAAAIDHLIECAPPCEEAAVVFLGDFMHYDSFDTVTPTSRNNLDADGRFPKMVAVAMRAMRRTIERAAARHYRVRVVVEIGNHDLSSSIFLMQALDNIYADNPRITVDTSPRHFHYFTFGSNLIGTHHGHGVKPEQLPLVMASDRPTDWGNSRHRYWWSGHVHHMSVRDYAGCSVESFRVLPPTDAWAANRGYRSRRDMKAIILHREYGEVARHVVSPMMLEAPQ